MKTLEKLSDAYKNHRELILIGLVHKHYNRVYDSHISEISGSLSVADFFTDLVDKLLDGTEYKDAVTYAINDDTSENIGSSVWVYFHMKYDTPLDWYYFDKAESIIDELIKPSKRDVAIQQVDAIKKLHSKGHNIVTCCHCGEPLIVDIQQEYIDCFCGNNVNINDCSDLYYSGIENSKIYEDK